MTSLIKEMSVIVKQCYAQEAIMLTKSVKFLTVLTDKLMLSLHSILCKFSPNIHFLILAISNTFLFNS
jgi:hypothetical protein